MNDNNKRKQALGRGFETLLPGSLNKGVVLGSEERVEKIALNDLEANPNQPRKHFDNQSLSELATSIKQYGIIQPLIFTPESAGKFIIIAGERRFRAAKQAGLDSIPVIIRSSKKLEQLEIALIENVQRVDLNALEQAASIERLHEQFSLSYEDIAKRLGKAISTVNNIVRLLQLPDEAKQALIDGKISEGHARAILSLKNDLERQAYLLKAIISLNWNVRQAERFVISIKEGIKETAEASKRTETETPETKRISQKLGTQVRIKRMAYGGRLEIDFSSDKDLNRLLKFFD
jgi:ParB family chromosome partitioning protein